MQEMWWEEDPAAEKEAQEDLSEKEYLSKRVVAKAP